MKSGWTVTRSAHSFKSATVLCSVCVTFLQISDRTLQRLRAKGVVAFSNIGGRCYYKIGELKRLLEERLIKSNDECMRNLITNHELYAKERRNTKQDK